MTSRFSHRTLAIAAGLIMVTSLWGGMLAAQPVPTAPPLPINEQTDDCVPFDESPLSLYDIDGVTGPDAHLQVNPLDLDGDGFGNHIEFVRLSDPTDERSTPFDRDGDGVRNRDGGGTDEPEHGGCDYDASLPLEFGVSIEHDADDEITRGDSLTVTAHVHDLDDEGNPTDPREVDRVELTIVKSDGSEEGPIEMTEQSTGVYTHEVTTDLDSPAGEWFFEATAFDGGTSAKVPDGGLAGTSADQRASVLVEVATHAPEIKFFECEDDQCTEHSELFFAGQVITVRAFPDPSKIDLDDEAAETATLFYVVTTSSGDESPELQKEMELQGKSYWEATLDPQNPTDNPFFVPEDAPGAVRDELQADAVTFDVRVEAADAGDETVPLDDPNTASAEGTIDVTFGLAFRIVAELPEDVTPRGGTLQFVGEYQRATQEGGWVKEPNAPGAGRALIWTQPDQGETLVADVPLTHVGDAVFKGSYDIGMGDQIDTDPLGDPEPNYYVTFDVGDAFTTDNEYPVEPADISGEMTVTNPDPDGTDDVFEPIIDENNPEPTFPIEVEYEPPLGPETPFAFDSDDDGDAPGTAEATVIAAGGAPVGVQELTWVGDQFEGTVHVPKVAAVAAGGSWTVRVDHSDDADDAPNRGSDEQQIVVNAVLQPGGTTSEPARANINLIAGSNTANALMPPTKGLTGVDAVDYDDVLEDTTDDDERNLLPVDDGETSHRFITIQGQATPQMIERPDGTTTDRDVTMVGVQFNDFGIEGMDLYRLALPDDNGNWQVSIDSQEYCVRELIRVGALCDGVDSSQDIPITAYAYTGEVVPPTIANGWTFYLPSDATGTFGPLETATLPFVYNGPSDLDVWVLGNTAAGDDMLELPPGPSISKVDNVKFRLDPSDKAGQFLVEDMVEFALVRAQWQNCFENQDDPEDFVWNPDHAPFDLGFINALRSNEWCIREHYRSDGTVNVAAQGYWGTFDYPLEDSFDPMEAVPDSCTDTANLIGCDRFEITLPGPLFQQGGIHGTWPSNGERFWVRAHATNALGYESGLDTINLHGVDRESGPDREFSVSTGDFAPDSPTMPDFDGPQFTYIPHDAQVVRVGPLHDWRAEESYGKQRVAPEFLVTENGDAYWDFGEEPLGREDYSGSGDDRDILGLASDETIPIIEFFGEGYINARDTTTHIPESHQTMEIALLLSEGCASLCDEKPVMGDAFEINEDAVTVIAVENLQSPDEEKADDGVANDLSWHTTIDDLSTWANQEFVDWRHESSGNPWDQDRTVQGRLRITMTFTTDTGIQETDSVYIQIDMNAFPDIELVDATSVDLVEGETTHLPDQVGNAAGPVIECTTVCTLRFKVFDFDGISQDGGDDNYGRNVDGIEFGPRIIQPDQSDAEFAAWFAGLRPDPWEWAFDDEGMAFAGIIPGIENDRGEPAAAFYTYTFRTVVPDEEKALPTRTNPGMFGGGSDMIYSDGDEHRVGARAFDDVEIVAGDQQEEGYGCYPGGGILCVLYTEITDQPFQEIRLKPDNDRDGDGWSNEFEDWVGRSIVDGSYRDPNQEPGNGQPFYGQVGIPEEVTNGLPLNAGSMTLTSPSGVADTVSAAGSTPCDLDGDGVPNDVGCLGIMNLEELFHMHPFLPDSFLDDPNGNGIPNFADPFQTYRFDCADNDFDGHCNQDEEDAGSDPDNPQSVPGDTNGNHIPDNIERQLAPVSDFDGDGYSNRLEITWGSDATDPCSTPDNTRRATGDFDGDGYSDRGEIASGSDPFDPHDPEPRTDPNQACQNQSGG